MNADGRRLEKCGNSGDRYFGSWLICVLFICVHLRLSVDRSILGFVIAIGRPPRRPLISISTLRYPFPSIRVYSRFFSRDLCASVVSILARFLPICAVIYLATIDRIISLPSVLSV